MLEVRRQLRPHLKAARMILVPLGGLDGPWNAGTGRNWSKSPPACERQPAPVRVQVAEGQVGEGRSIVRNPQGNIRAVPRTANLQSAPFDQNARWLINEARAKAGGYPAFVGPVIAPSCARKKFF